MTDVSLTFPGHPSSTVRAGPHQGQNNCAVEFHALSGGRSCEAGHHAGDEHGNRIDRLVDEIIGAEESRAPRPEMAEVDHPGAPRSRRAKRVAEHGATNVARYEITAGAPTRGVTAHVSPGVTLTVPPIVTPERVG